MSIDLSRPLVDSQGQHDPLDGLVTFLELKSVELALDEAGMPDLDAAITGLAAMCEGQPLATADPLGIGGLLTAAHTLAQLQAAGVGGYSHLLAALLDCALPGLEYYAVDQGDLSLPAGDRLAFRELGLSIGLKALRDTQALAAQNPQAFGSVHSLGSRLAKLRHYDPLVDAIEGFWTEPRSRRSGAWKEHEDINAVMLATSLAPEAFLSF